MLCSRRAFVRQGGLDSPQKSSMISSQLDATSFCICPNHLDVSKPQGPLSTEACLPVRHAAGLIGQIIIKPGVNEPHLCCLYLKSLAPGV
jgi:hypothetical protein